MNDMAENWKMQLAVLPIGERAELARFLLNSLEDEADPDAEESWDAELDRRVAEVQSGKARLVPAEQVFARLRQKYP